MTAITQRAGRAAIGHPGGAIEAKQVIVCAGLWSDRVATASGCSADPRIVPFLGVHITPTIDGEVLLSPTALPVASRTAYRLGTLDLAYVRNAPSPVATSAIALAAEIVRRWESRG